MGPLVTVLAVGCAIYFITDNMSSRTKGAICGAVMILMLLTGSCGFDEFR